MSVLVAPDGTRYALYRLGTVAKLYRYEASTRAWTLLSTTSSGNYVMAAAVDSQGGVHVAYSYSNNGYNQVRYTRYDPGSGTWSGPEIAFSSSTTSDAVQHVDVALDGSDLPVIAYGYETGSTFARYRAMRYTRRDAAGGWSTVSVATTTSFAEIYVAVDSAGDVHTAYNYNNSNAPAAVRYRRPDGTVETIDTGGGFYRLYDFGLDSNNAPVALYEYEAYSLFTRRRGVTGWTEPRSGVPGVSNPTVGALALDAADRPHVAAGNLLGGGDPGAFYSTDDGGGWTPLQRLSSGSTTDVAATTSGNDIYVMYSVDSGPDAGVWVASNVDLGALVLPEPRGIALLALAAGVLWVALRRRF